jgi:hypothetical protein
MCTAQAIVLWVDRSKGRATAVHGTGSPVCGGRRHSSGTPDAAWLERTFAVCHKPCYKASQLCLACSHTLMNTLALEIPFHAQDHLSTLLDAVDAQQEQCRCVSLGGAT